MEDESDLVYVGEDNGAELEHCDVVEDQEKEYYADDDGVGLGGGDNETIELEEHEADLNEDAYEIRDEEDNAEENIEDLEKDPTAGGDEKLADADAEADEKTEVGKDDNMLVVDEWDNDDAESILSDEEDLSKTEDGKAAPDPEECEKALLHMPSLKTIMGDLLHLRRNRRLSIYPVTIADLSNPTIQKHLESDTCEEVKTQFIRPSDDPKSWTGFLSLTFVTSKNATQAVDAFKAIREDLTVKVDTNPDASLDSFLKGERKNAAWPSFWSDRLLLVRSIPLVTKPEELRAVFTDAEEIVVAKESTSATPRRRESAGGSALGYAYVLYETPEAAKKAAEDLVAAQAEFNQKRLDIHLYREPVTEVPRSLLYLRRRRLVLRHLENLNRKVERSKSDPEYKLPPWCETRIAACKALIEKDDKTRKELNLPAPTYAEFKTMKGFRKHTPQDAEKMLISMGIISRTKKPGNAGQQTRRDNNKPGNRRSDKDNKGRGGRGGRGNFRRGDSPRGQRRSPPRRRNDWGSDSRSGGFMNRNRSGGPRGMNQPPGGLGMMNPLALMMQQNMGLLGAGGLVNPAMLNQIMMQPGAPMAMGGLMGSGGAGMQGAAPLSLLSNLGGGAGHLEPPPKMLRLDETGNLRSDRDFRQDRDGRGFDRGPRDDRGMFRDRGRQRSRSPIDHRMQPMRSQRGGRGGNFGGGAQRGFESSGPGPSGTPRGGGGEDDINLLMNLSKMLSQKMEQKRQQVEHGYDRM